MAKCKAKTTSGKPCRMQALKGSDYCFNHSPAKAAERADARKRGGENRHTPHFADLETLPKDVKTLDDARSLLTYTLQEVAGMDNTIARARVLLSIHESFLRSIEIGELEARLSALEATLSAPTQPNGQDPKVQEPKHKPKIQGRPWKP